MSRALDPDAKPATSASSRRLAPRGAGLVGLCVLVLMVLACVGSLGWTLGSTTRHLPTAEAGVSLPAGLPRYKAGDPREARLPPSWWSIGADDAQRLNALVPADVVQKLSNAHGIEPAEVVRQTSGPVADALRSHWPMTKDPIWFGLGTDVLGRSLLARTLAGGGISLVVGIAAAGLAVIIGTLYGAFAAMAGGTIDAIMMRVVDVLYGLPSVLLVVLIAVAGDAILDEYVSRSGARTAWVLGQAQAESLARDGDSSLAAAQALLARDGTLRASLEGRALADPGLQPRQLSQGARAAYGILTLLVAIGGVSWLTLARVVRGQVLSLKARPFMEAARAMGAGWFWQFRVHLLRNLAGPIVVYATLAAPQAILQESFLSFLGIGIKPPLPSWGNLAADGLAELNPYRSHWWLFVFPCVLLAITLLALNFVGESLREALDPKRARSR